MAPGELDLSEWARRGEARRRDADQLRQRVLAALPGLTPVLTEHGVTEAYLFGSVATGRCRPESDVDIAVTGCAAERFYQLAARLERALDVPLDLLDLGRAPPELAKEVRSTGVRFHPTPGGDG
jgi:predicted nucleotidyltransferase